MRRAWGILDRIDAPDYDEPDRNYMTRWRLVSTPWFGVYVHRLDEPDPRPTLHDHPWPFLSLVVRGGYTEEVGIWRDGHEGRVVGRRRARSWRRGSVHRMRTTDAHTISQLHRRPTWTFLLVGRRRRPEPSWGYWDDQGYTPFDRHPHATDFAAALAARRAARPPSPGRWRHRRARPSARPPGANGEHGILGVARDDRPNGAPRRRSSGERRQK